ncbi:MAG: hypothetical protein ABI553_07505, partial [Chloroflexota bacterium]
GAIGNAIILAARLSADAGPGEILIAQRTFASAEDAIEANFAGDRTVKGFSRPVATYAVTGSVGRETAASMVSSAPGAGPTIGEPGETASP